jgi:hypothetical protein
MDVEILIFSSSFFIAFLCYLFFFSFALCRIFVFQIFIASPHAPLLFDFLLSFLLSLHFHLCFCLCFFFSYRFHL